MAEVRVPLPDSQSKSYACSCGRYGPGNAYGVATHRSKTKCGGHVLVILDMPDAEAAGDPPADATTAPAASAASPDMVVVDGQPAAGRLVEPKGTAPTAFRQQVETTAELRTYFDYFHVALRYEGDFSRWLEEMARLAVEELFGLELTMRVRQRQQEQERKSA